MKQKRNFEESVAQNDTGTRGPPVNSRIKQKSALLAQENMFPHATHSLSTPKNNPKAILTK